MRSASVARKQILRILVLVVVACFLDANSRAQAPDTLSGYWDLQVPNGDGTARDTYFLLNQKGTVIAGTLFGRGLTGTPVQGTIEAGAVHLATTPDVSASSTTPPRSIAYNGSFQDGKLTLKTPGSHGQVLQGIAYPTTKEIASPSPLPLPPLRDLPDDGLARTPPMGWNSWNKFAHSINDADVRMIADAMVSSGMSKLGYVYINIDDTWEGGRDRTGNLISNQKFPDMKALADYVHSKGLKIGIYSSPGPKTCAGYEGSFGHEGQDARTFASWGIDYLKYDLCSARTVYPSTLANEQGLYQKMGEALQSSGRPIVYSLCQYGEDDVWQWGSKVGGNLWRTTGDIHDSWDSMDRIGFRQISIAPFARPGHWNDPDMLEIGNGGMNADEYRTHMSLWSLLSAPLIAGNDIRSMSEETKSILMNPEIIAVDQDPAAHPVQTFSTTGPIEILERQMQDGSLIVGIFNRGGQAVPAGFKWSSLPIHATAKDLQARDLWKHDSIPISGDAFESTVPPHGVTMLRVSASH